MTEEEVFDLETRVVLPEMDRLYGGFMDSEDYVKLRHNICLIREHRGIEFKDLWQHYINEAKMNTEATKQKKYRLHFDVTGDLMMVRDQHDDSHDAYDLTTGNLQDALDTIDLWETNAAPDTIKGKLHAVQAVRAYYAGRHSMPAPAPPTGVAAAHAHAAAVNARVPRTAKRPAHSTSGEQIPRYPGQLAERSMTAQELVYAFQNGKYQFIRDMLAEPGGGLLLLEISGLLRSEELERARIAIKEMKPK